MRRVVEILTILAAIFGVIVGGIQAYDRFFAPAGKLKAEVRYGVFKMPPTLRQNIDSLSMLMKISDKKVDKLISINKIDAKSADGVRTILEALSEAALKRIDSVKSDYSLLSEGYWIVSLVNDGDKEIRNVQVKLPTFFSALVTNEDGSTKLLTKEKMLSLGDFQPSQKANIFAWAVQAPREWDLENIKIRHSEGFASVSFYMPISGIFAFLHSNSFPISMILWLIALGIFYIVLEYQKLKLDAKLKKGPTKIGRIEPQSITAQKSPPED